MAAPVAESVASSQPGPDSAAALLGDVLPWLGLLLLLILVGWLVILALRRRVAADDAEGEPFTLEGLRELRRSGKLTEEEFARARDAMIAATRRSMERHRAGPGAGGASGGSRGPGTDRTG